MNLKKNHYSRRALTLLLTLVMCVGMIPTAFAAQQNSYHDPAEHWMQASGRTNELDANSVVTRETFKCGECGKATSFEVFRVPEYTRNGQPALSRNVKYSDGTMVDGVGKGDTMDGIPGKDATYTGYHYTKAVCETCGGINTNMSKSEYGYFGIETGENSFGYIATWSKGKELPELKASLETINHTASGLITDIDRNYKALIKERGLDKEPESLAAEPVQEITVQEPEPVSAPDNGSVPDPAISVESMNAYGYTDSNMLPLTKERALELMERDVTVYMLHTDNTEAMAFDADEIRSFDGIFGVEASEWGTVKDRFVPQDYEKAFLDNPADSFAIYQLRDNDDTVQLRYMNSEYLEKKGLSARRENYAAVYAGSLDRRGDTQDKLNELYETFDIRRPEDFCGHSLSVSDIVALKQNGVVSCHYVDSWGFKELPGFLKPENYLKNAEMAMEDDYGMIDGIINNGPRKTVAELEEQSRNGTPISLLELAQAVQREDEEKHRAQQPVRREKSSEKPSILAKLKALPVADTKSVKSAPKRSAEREL